MADREQSGSRLPIKLILPAQGSERKVKGRGSPPKPFRAVTLDLRNGLVRRVHAIRDALASQIERVGAVPVRVKMLNLAIAKSHRPTTLFSDKTCPVIGAGSPGELFVKGSEKGLRRLQAMFELGESAQLLKEISSVETIEAVTPQFRRRGRSSKEILEKSPRVGNGFLAQVRLFNFGADESQFKLVADFENVCRKSGIALSQEGYSDHSHTYGAECRTVKDIETLSAIPGVRSLSNMPVIRTVRSSLRKPAAVPTLPYRNDVEGELPIVAVVDSGIIDTNERLNSWVIGRDSLVAPHYRNPSHGTFVAGLLCWGDLLNPELTGIASGPCEIYDFQVLPNADPAVGATEAVTEQEFLIGLEDSLRKHANKIKVWNLSLGTDRVCRLDEFSEFAVELDNLQERYQVSFVISAGNFGTLPLLAYPRRAQHQEPGRITAPADSVLGVTVGSIAHVGYEDQGPGVHEPSAFSRHGAGPNYVIKPDLVHFGGSCSVDGKNVDGIRSISGDDSVENIGTSFSTPLVSRMLAHIYHDITPAPSPVLARSLLTHHARDPRNGHRVPDREENYFGFGLPASVPTCLECTPYTSTLVFEDTLRPGYFLEWDDFPYPPCLIRNGRFFGELWMTVAFAPARGARWGSEYCETHIDAHLGVYTHGMRKGVRKSIFKGLVPPEHKNKGLLYESYQVATLRKWAPVRTYHGKLPERGQKGNKWRLMVRLLTRHGVEEESLKAQPFALIVTISDPSRTLPVYDEMARLIRSRFQAENIAVRSAARIRAVAR